MTKKLYAGIGPRKTPTEWLETMTGIAESLSQTQWVLRSGHGTGADQAFEVGSPKHLKKVFVPFIGFNTSLPESHYVETIPSVTLLQIAADHHRAWTGLSDMAKMLLARNVNILLGESLNDPVSCVIYWLPTGQENIMLKGGTRHSLRVAKTFGIPCFNINKEHEQIALCAFTKQSEEAHD